MGSSSGCKGSYVLSIKEKKKKRARARCKSAGLTPRTGRRVQGASAQGASTHHTPQVGASTRHTGKAPTAGAGGGGGGGGLECVLFGYIPFSKR